MAHDPKQSFLNLARYNQRANREVYDILALLTGRARKQETGSFFGSIHGLLNHIIICDINWLKRYRPLSPESPVLTDPRLDPPNLSWEHDLQDNFVDLREDRVMVDERICAWFEEFPSSRYGEVFAYQDSKGNRQQPTAAAAFEFLFLHQTHHRGQISQILDAMGISNNLLDNLAYLK